MPSFNCFNRPSRRYHLQLTQQQPVICMQHSDCAALSGQKQGLCSWCSSHTKTEMLEQQSNWIICKKSRRKGVHFQTFITRYNYQTQVLGKKCVFGLLTDMPIRVITHACRRDFSVSQNTVCECACVFVWKGTELSRERQRFEDEDGSKFAVKWARKWSWGMIFPAYTSIHICYVSISAYWIQ